MLPGIENRDTVEDINKENEAFIRVLANKGSFMVNWFEGALREYENRVEVVIRRVFDDCYGKIQFGKDEFQISNEKVDKLYKFVEMNIDKLIKISLKQNTEMYEGGRESLSVKYKSVYMTISRRNTSSALERQEIESIKDGMKDILTSTVFPQEKEFKNDTLQPNDSIVDYIVNKINEAPYNTEMTIAELIGYNPEVAPVEPLTQGAIMHAVFEKCENNGIKLEENMDEIGGLMYFVKFKKIEA